MGGWDETSMARLFPLCVKDDFAVYTQLPPSGKGIQSIHAASPWGRIQPRSLPWVIALPGATLRVSQTLPPMVEPLPMVIRPRIVAPA